MGDFDFIQSAISGHAFDDEQQCVQAMLASLDVISGKRPAIFSRASDLVTRIRAAGSGKGVEAFLNTYGLNTREGVAVMCLAEALLRIPDYTTADRLIQDKFENTEWNKYLGTSESFFVNASSWGLLLTGKVVNLGTMPEEKPSALFGKLVARAGEPVIREALKQSMRFIGTQFVLGEDIEEAIKKSIAPEKKGYRFSYDILGEGARNQEQAGGYVKAYRHAITEIGKHGKGRAIMGAPSISLKLSALHPRYSLASEERVMKELLPRLIEIVELAMKVGISVSIDAEEATRLDVELRLFRKLFNDRRFRDYEGIGFVMQAYQKRAVHLIDYLAELSREAGRRMPVRLVKGAYWDSEIKNSQVYGLPSYPVFTRKEHTDVSYMACAQKLITNIDRFYPQFATHNALTVASIIELAGGKGKFEFQRLHGMGEQLHDQVVKDVPVRIYAPVGRHEDLLAYLIRRLLENGANTSFVHMLMDKNTPLEQLLEDPVEIARKQGGAQNPMTPNPVRLYSDRKNSQGYDLGNATMVSELASRMNEFKDCFWLAEPTHTGSGENPEKKNVTEPADKAKIVGYAVKEKPENVDKTITTAKAAFNRWNKTPVEERARIIERFAQLLADSQVEAMAIVMREAGKTLPDAIAEVREATDFCHYYAAQARKLTGGETVLEGPTGERNSLQLTARGVFACISPWNFPLAIFTGQVVAALVTGNCVIAKPAEQTPLIAAFAVRLMHQAGVPKDVLHLTPGSGSKIGAALTKDERIAGVVFTGSMETAQLINRSLAARGGPIAVFIAETGGQNCMIVDSSALPEQVTDDVILSAFGSAGQRCSALRVLYVQDDIADNLIRLISGAMQELKIGNPFFDPSVDIGPVIDDGARKGLAEHIEKMKKSANLLATAPLDVKLAQQGSFLTPHLFEIKSIRELPQEVFGPVLHVIRYKASDLEKVCDEINSTGYGLTFGLQSRIEDHVDLVKERIHAGNIYVNRSMIGATVGVQPFGGEGLSGTGPKAGGPHYLLRFVTERTHTINTAAIGGNLELLSKKA